MTQQIAQDDDELLQDDGEIEYMDRVVQTWDAWSYGSDKLKGAAASMVLGVCRESRMDGLLALSDDQLTDVDIEIAGLGGEQAHIIEVHYRSGENESMDSRYARCRTDQDGYDVRLRATLQVLYNRLMPEIRNWWLASS